MANDKQIKSTDLGGHFRTLIERAEADRRILLGEPQTEAKRPAKEPDTSPEKGEQKHGNDDKGR